MNYFTIDLIHVYTTVGRLYSDCKYFPGAADRDRLRDYTWDMASEVKPAMMKVASITIINPILAPVLI